MHLVAMHSRDRSNMYWLRSTLPGMYSEQGKVRASDKMITSQATSKQHVGETLGQDVDLATATVCYVAPLMCS